MDGQANTAPSPMDELVDILADNHEAGEQEDEQPTGDEPSEELDNSDTEDDEDSPADEEEGDEPDDSEDAKEQTSALKFKVPVKGEDGADTTIEVDEKELVAGYQRHADYTRKTQELSNREREAFDVVSKKLDDGLNHSMQEVAKARAAIHQLAGLRSEQEMAQLAATDQAAWVQERARMEAVNGVLSQLDQSLEMQRHQQQQQLRAAEQQEAAQAWEVLRKEGIDESKLKGIFDRIVKDYGANPKKVYSARDPALVKIMRDAVAYRELKDKAPTVQKKVQNAPKLPAQRQNVPRSEKVSRALNDRFKGGRAKEKDLAALIHQLNF